MGNTSSRDPLFKRSMRVYKNGLYFGNYTVSNYNDEHIYFENSKPSLKFIKDDSLLYLKIKYNNAYYSINPTKTYKEGDTQFIEIILNQSIDRTQDSSFTNATHLIQWQTDLKKIHFNLNISIMHYQEE